MSADRQPASLEVGRLMSDLEDDVRRARRKRLLARGGATDYRDVDLYEKVDVTLRRALEARDHDALLLPDLLDSDEEWRLSLHLKWASHRSGVGPLLILVKRRLLLPMFRWLWEYSLENFRIQRRVNKVLFACVEELAIENARLRQALEGAGRAPSPQPPAVSSGSQAPSRQSE